MELDPVADPSALDRRRAALYPNGVPSRVASGAHERPDPGAEVEHAWMRSDEWRDVLQLQLSPRALGLVVGDIRILRTPAHLHVGDRRLRGRPRRLVGEAARGALGYRRLHPKRDGDDVRR